MLRRSLPYAAGILACAIFCLLGAFFLPLPGAQYDETLFVNAIHVPQNIEFVLDTESGKIPIMLMNYLGTLKAFLYMPVLRWFGAGTWTLRLPMLLAAACSLWLFFLAMKRLAGTWPASLAALLLSTDVIYLLTSVYDWGPVALQHVFFTATLYSLLRYLDGRRAAWLLLAGFCCGLALWDKALFIWLLGAFGIAALALFPKEIWSIARNWRHALLCVAGFVIGALPFLYYNVSSGWQTFDGTERLDPNAKSKLVILDRTFDGSALLGYIVAESPEGPPLNLRSWEKAPLFLNQKVRNHRNSFQHILLVGSLILAPLLCWFGPHRRAAIFFLFGAVLAYLQMVFNQRTGGAAHHTILLWPVPQILLALLLAQAAQWWPERGIRAGAVIVGICMLSNLVVFNTYAAHFIACGPTWFWSDAIRPLINEIGATPGRLAFPVDWGISQQIEWYGNGKLGFYRGSDGVIADLPSTTPALEKALEDPATIFISRTEGREAFPGTRQKMINFAAERGYRDTIAKVIRDRHNTPIFEIHEFRK